MISKAMASVTGLNHLTVAVGDVQRSLDFYRDILGCGLRAHWPKGAYLEAGSFWICLSHDPVARSGPHPDYSHVAFSVSGEDFPILADRIRRECVIWKDNRSEGASVYFLDPDGHKLEIHVGSLQDRLRHYAADESSPVVIVNPTPDGLKAPAA
jgi:catechol 2,3-dioxygenase-like lactoylglutathione lyase family enzyme